MKITCILTSFNRPTMLRHALKSVQDQTHKDYELLVFDDSSILQIGGIVGEFKFPQVTVTHTDVPLPERRSTNRLSINCNRGLAMATGDLVCWLCDDDYYYPDWFRSASAFFKGNKDKNVAFGILKYSREREMVFPKDGNGLFHKNPITNPSCQVDHNQVIHRRFKPPFRWPESTTNMGAPDADYFASIAKAGHVFHPIEAHAVVKRKHGKNLQNTYKELGTPQGETIRE